MKRDSQNLSDLCGSLGEDDCIDPKEFFDRRKASSGKNRKSEQLCQQVHRTLQLGIATGEDDLIDSLDVQSVEPAGGSAQLMVLVSSHLPKHEASDAEILAQLVRHQGRLRTMVAQAITRRRTPRLMFRLVPRPATGDAGITES